MRECHTTLSNAAIAKSKSNEKERGRTRQAEIGAALKEPLPENIHEDFRTMIVDRLHNYKLYPFGKAWQLAFDFLLTLHPDAEEKKYPLLGDDLFAIVMSYKTAPPETAEIEAHRKYLDIQAVITGEEGIGWSQADDLEIDTPYDAAKDAELYKRPAQGLLRVDLFPGDFMALFPHDAHMPSIMTRQGPVFTKKVVVKMGVHLL